MCDLLPLLVRTYFLFSVPAFQITQGVGFSFGMDMSCLALGTPYRVVIWALGDSLVTFPIADTLLCLF